MDSYDGTVLYIVIYHFVLSAVFNTLVLFCIRDIYVALQRMLSLKPGKDQRKYVVDVFSARLINC